MEYGLGPEHDWSSHAPLMRSAWWQSLMKSRRERPASINQSNIRSWGLC